MLRKYDVFYNKLGRTDMRGLTKLTSCEKPCHYRRYRFIGDQRVSSTGAGTPSFTFSVWAVSNDTMQEREHLVYPFSSLHPGPLGLDSLKQGSQRLVAPVAPAADRQSEISWTSFLPNSHYFVHILHCNFSG